MGEVPLDDLARCLTGLKPINPDQSRTKTLQTSPLDRAERQANRQIDGNTDFCTCKDQSEAEIAAGFFNHRGGAREDQTLLNTSAYDIACSADFVAGPGVVDVELDQQARFDFTQRRDVILRWHELWWIEDSRF